MKRLLFAALASASFGVPPVMAQQFTTAAEVRPILEATRANWVAIREFNGRDLLYFTHLIAWRCGLSSIAYALNDEVEFTEWPMPECREGTANPARITETDPVYTTLPIWNVGRVTVLLTYDDGTVSEASYDRTMIQID
ncbi:MAG: hypothetical protein AAF631_13715 [Pseudomonadota bacterium]